MCATKIYCAFDIAYLLICYVDRISHVLNALFMLTLLTFIFNENLHVIICNFDFITISLSRDNPSQYL